MTIKGIHFYLVLATRTSGCKFFQDQTVEHRAMITHNNAGEHWRGEHGVVERIPGKKMLLLNITNLNTLMYILFISHFLFFKNLSSLKLTGQC